MATGNGITPLLIAFLLSLVAGLGTGLGGLIVVLRRPSPRSYGFLMGLTAGVMITLAFLELVNEAWELEGYLTATAGFAAGALFMFLMDVSIPHIRFGEAEIPHLEGRPSAGSMQAARAADDFGARRALQAEPPPSTPPLAAPMAAPLAAPSPSDRQRRPNWEGRGRRRWLGGFGPSAPASHRRRRMQHAEQGAPFNPALLKSGLLIAIGITIHNLPEGIAVGAGYIHRPAFGLFIALAILLHNIPEGIATALPLCCGGAGRWVAFRAALLSGLAEPLGALLAATVLTSFHSLIGAALAFAGGVMVFITLDELIPAAREQGHHHLTALGIILGAISVFLLSGAFGV